MITITFYNNSAESNRANKTAFLTNETLVDGVFRDEVSVVNPIIIIESNSFPKFNYCYINALGRFYFVDNITVIRDRLYEVTCTVDVLMTYYNTLINQIGFIDVQENRYSADIIDNNIGFEQGYEVEEYTLENDLYDETIYTNKAGANYILMGLGVTADTPVSQEE